MQCYNQSVEYFPNVGGSINGPLASFLFASLQCFTNCFSAQKAKLTYILYGKGGWVAGWEGVVSRKSVRFYCTCCNHQASQLQSWGMSVNYLHDFCLPNSSLKWCNKDPPGTMEIAITMWYNCCDILRVFVPVKSIWNKMNGIKCQIVAFDIMCSTVWVRVSFGNTHAALRIIQSKAGSLRCRHNRIVLMTCKTHWEAASQHCDIGWTFACPRSQCVQ